MFIVLQFPITDARSFISSESYRLLSPLWDMPRPNKDFVRSFGVVEPRLKGGTSDWSGEDLFCRANRAIRFEPPFTKIISTDSSGVGTSSNTRSYCAFRRFFSDSDGVGRFEVGIGYRGFNQSFFTEDRLNSRFLARITHSVLTQNVLVPIKGKLEKTKLINAGELLANHYLAASTRYADGLLSPTEDWWTAPGELLMLLEYRFDELQELPVETRAVQSPTLIDAGIQLSYLWAEVHGKHFGTWLLGYSPVSVDKRTLRQLRINLLRLHAERENLKEIFRLILRGQIGSQVGTPTSDALQKYLKRAMRAISKDYRYGLPQSSILKVAIKAKDFVNEGERERLLLKLSDIRPSVLKNLKEFTDSKDQQGNPKYSFLESIGKIDSNGGSITFVYSPQGTGIMDKSQKIDFSGISGSVSISGGVDQVAAQSIRDSFKKVDQDSGIDQSLKNRLEELAQAVADMSEHLPETLQQRAAQDFQTLTEQATSTKPDKKWYELSSKGLIDAAKTVGEIATPVVSATKAILALL